MYLTETNKSNSMLDSMNGKRVLTPTIIDDCQETSKCTKCDYEFKIGESFLEHFNHCHIEYIFNLLSAGEKALGLEHDKTPDEFHLKREQSRKDGFAPRCKKCNHDKPDYIVVSHIPHKDGIKLRCVHCGDISVKD